MITELVILIAILLFALLMSISDNKKSLTCALGFHTYSETERIGPVMHVISSLSTINYECTACGHTKNERG